MTDRPEANDIRISDSLSTGKATRLNLPLIALRQLVIFPGVTLPVIAGRPRTLKAIEAASNDPEGNPDKLLFAVLQREDSEDIEPGGLHTIGTIASIDQLQRGLGGAQLLVSGRSRGIALRVEDHDGYYSATVTEADELLPPNPDDLAFVALHKEARSRAAQLGERTGLPTEVTQQVLSSVDHPGRFADLVAGYLDVSAQERQKLLETLSIEERLRKILTLIERQLSVLEAQEDIKSAVQEELGDRQREMYLREQLKAIQKELGEGDGQDVELEELKERLDGLDLPEDAEKEIEREFKRLERMSREAMEAQVIRNFLETVSELPWNERSDDHLELDKASEILEEDHYGLPEVKDRVLEFLAVRQMREQRDTDQSSDKQAGASAADVSEEEGSEAKDTRPSVVRRGRSPILLFTGPPGVGKTSLAKSIARAMGREYVRISLGGVRDEADIRGHRRTYVGAMPGRIIKGMKEAGTRNPVFLLDEVDKLGQSYQGDPASALLEVLDPAQNDSFTDHYLGMPFDLSEVFFIATSNFLQNIPGPLLDRMEVVDFSGYTASEKLEIAKRYLVPRQVEDGGLTSDMVEFPDDGLKTLIDRYTREAGVRQLEREIGRVIRKAARRLAVAQDTEQVQEKISVDAKLLRELLGREKVQPERASESDQVGVATGMYYTPVGGDIMFVEASTMPGKGKLTLTGQLGDVMKESAQAALSYAKANASALGIPAENFECDIHIHCPAGAIPKDGPSAGVTMATALVSALSRRKARADLAMTGEITLSGRVLPIGGVKEKVLGAVRAGINNILLPKDNEGDLEDLSEEVRKTIQVTFAENLGQVLAAALPSATFVHGRLLFTGAADESGELRGLTGMH
jgi:ATP-dependent Lon protease